MALLYLISIIFGLLIFLILVLIITNEDQKAGIRIRSQLLSQESTSHKSWRKRILPVLDVIKLPGRISQVIDEQTVIWSGIQMSHHQFVVSWWLLSLVGVLLGLIILGFGISFGYPLSFAFVITHVVAPYFYLKVRIRERQRAVERSLPDFLDMLTFTVEAGLGLVPALKRVSKNFKGALGEDMRGALIQIELGFSRQEALEDLTKRLPSSDVDQFVEAILLTERLGTSLARTMRVQSSLLRTRRRQRAEVKAQTAPIRIIPALVFFFLPSLLLIYLAPPIINFLLRN
jgi:Flp pilus assembly protein TadB